MLNGFEDVQKTAKDNMEKTIASFSAVSKGIQTLAAETADYAKKSIEQNTAAVEKLMAVKSLDKAIEVQTDLAKDAYQSFINQANKFNDLVMSISKDAAKPFEGFIAAATAASNGKQR